MAAQETLTLSDGQSYVFTEPTLGHLIEMEQIVGSLLDSDVLNKLPSRAYLIVTCLRERHPDITLGLINSWRWADYARALTAALAVCPLWRSSAQPMSEGDSSSTESPTPPVS